MIGGLEPVPDTIDAELWDTMLDRWPPRLDHYGHTAETLAAEIAYRWDGRRRGLPVPGPDNLEAAMAYCTLKIIRRWTEAVGDKAALAEGLRFGASKTLRR
jgi:hypothetical protein